jgi:hypothetical protein
MITLAEELLLLAIEDDGKLAYTAGSPAFGMAIIGACLFDLNVLGRIDADLSEIRVLSRAPTGQPALDAVLGKVAGGPARSIALWVLDLQLDVPTLVRGILTSLSGRGILQPKDKQFLWVLRSRRYPVIDGQELKEAKLRILETLLGDGLPTPHDTALVGLAKVGGLLEGFLSSGEISRLESRINLVGGIDLIVRGTESAIREDGIARAYAFMQPIC